ncbi:MAG: polyprenyl synthetase family protein [Deltaproteobacteria bacterium]|nr:polyprenyl synthetase family protein [Deltaproteobacteria bacterium]
MSQAAWTEELRTVLVANLERFLATKRDEAVALSPRSVGLVDQVSSLTLRGGKRLRPVVLTATYRTVSGDGDFGPVLHAGAAMELLQTYLLIHDDWMDGDEERRGGPSVFAALRDQHGDARLGASLAVLAGDLASAYASELITMAPFPAPRRDAGLAAFWRLQREAFFGQQLDLVEAAGRPGETARRKSPEAAQSVERMYDLKTGSYTVRGPAVLGALLGGASDDAVEALTRWASPVGIAFQLRDELLGTFGDPRSTGKPTGGDLRQGKITTLVTAGRRLLSESALPRLEAVLGNEEASNEEVAAVTELLRTSGAKRVVEERLEGLTADAAGALGDLPYDTTELQMLTPMLIQRDH